MFVCVHTYICAHAYTHTHITGLHLYLKCGCDFESFFIFSCVISEFNGTYEVDDDYHFIDPENSLERLYRYQII